eukprot:PRCOL_00005468-RA
MTSDERCEVGAAAAAEEEALGLLRELSAQGAPEWAHVAARGGGGAGFLVTSGWSQRAPADGGKRAFARTFDVDASADAFPASALETTSPSAAELPSSGVELRSVSPSGARVFIVRTTAANGGGAKGARVAQLWTAAGLQWEAAVPATLHGAVCAGEPFGGADWSPSEGAVAYAADAPRRVRAAVSAAAPLAAVSTADKSEADGDKASVTGRTWEPTQDYAPDWGEAQGGAREAALFVVDCASGALARVAVPDAQELEPSAAHADGEQSAPSAGVSCAQPCWTCEAGLAFTAWPHPAGHRPGLAHCLNRPSAVCWAPSPHAADASGEAATEGDGEGGRGGALVVAQPGGSGASPVLAPAPAPGEDGGGSRLYFLSHARALATGVHMARADVCSVPWSGSGAAAAREAATATQDVLDVRAADSAKGCPPDGLWVTRLRRDMFALRGSLVATTQWRASRICVRVDLETGACDALPDPAAALGGGALLADSLLSSDAEVCACSADVLAGAAASDGADGAIFVAAVSSPASPPRLAALLMDGSAGGGAEWVALSEPQKATPALAAAASARWGVVHTPPPDGSADGTDCGSAVLLAPPADVRARGIVLLPHGGPHTAAPTAYIMSAAMFTQMGYAVAMPNYRGSFGYGDAFLEALPGRVGAVDEVPTVVWGGSHGGFLGAHLLGQHPEAFAAAALRNAVTNIASMVFSSDIPDWCATEALGCERGATAAWPPTQDELRTMWEVSPIQYAGSVRAPMLLLVGDSDQRVPREQSHQYRRALQAAGRGEAACECVEFAGEGHALGGTRTEAECLALAAAFFERAGGRAPAE